MMYLRFILLYSFKIYGISFKLPYRLLFKECNYNYNVIKKSKLASLYMISYNNDNLLASLLYYHCYQAIINVERIS